MEEQEVQRQKGRPAMEEQRNRNNSGLCQRLRTSTLSNAPTKNEQRRQKSSRKIAMNIHRHLRHPNNPTLDLRLRLNLHLHLHFNLNLPQSTQITRALSKGATSRTRGRSTSIS